MIEVICTRLRKQPVRQRSCEVTRYWQNVEKFSSPLIKKKAGGRYAADLVLQLPPRGSGSAALHSACYFYPDR